MNRVVRGRNRRPRQVGVTLLASLVLGPLTSCSGPGNSRAVTPTGSSPCTSPGVGTGTVDVGAVFPSTGPQGPFFEAVGSGIRARFAVANQAGGIGGRRLVLRTADDGDGPVENAAAARYLTADDRVFGIIEATTNSDASATFLHEQGLPVTGWAITPDWGRDDNMFGYGLSTSPKPGGEPVTRAAQFLKAHGATRVAVLAGGATASTTYARQFIATLGPVGLHLAYEDLAVALGQTDFSFDVSAMKRLGVDAIFTGLDPATNIDLLGAARAAGLPLRASMLPAGYDARLAAADGKVLEGAYVEIDWRPFELPVPAHQEFVSALRSVAPSEFPGQLAMVGWLSANLFILGLGKAGAACPTRSAFIHNLRQVKGYTADGLLPPTDFAQTFAKMPLCYWEVRIHDSKFQPAGTQPTCGQLLSRYKARHDR